MKKSFISLKKQMVAALILLFLFCACYEFEFVNQPGSADPNTSFTTDISIITTDGGGAWHTPYFGIKLPEGWTVTDNISFTYDDGEGIFVYSDSASLAMEMIEAAEPGYYWWVAQGAETVFYNYGQTYTFSPEIHTDDKTGSFYLDYMAGSSAGYYGGGLNWRRNNDNLITVGLADAIVVTSNNNDGPGSLREAIDSIDYYGTITFDLLNGNTIGLEEELSIYKDVTIAGSETDAVTISGENQTRIIFINTNNVPHFKNLILTEGNAQDGGGMYCMPGSQPILEQVSFLYNNAENDGGAIFMYQSNPVLTDVLIQHNNAQNGGGIYCYENSLPQLEQVTISENTAESYGGGLYCNWNSSPVFDTLNRSNVFLNSALYGTDIFSDFLLNVVVDTFTVMVPTEMHAYPLANFEFDILNGKIEQVSADLYVSPEGDDNNSGLSADEPLKTINVALLKMLTFPSDPHTIHLLEGIYSSSSNGETFPIIMRDFINIIGSDVSEVVLDAEGQSQLFIFQDVTSNQIKNMTLTGGLNNYGGAIYCHDSNPTLEDLNIVNNKATSRGGGIYLNGSNPVMKNVNIIGNRAYDYGGGLYSDYSNPVFSESDRCNIYLNLAARGDDLYSEDFMTIVVDTFTVLLPNQFHAYPIENFQFDILFGKIEQVTADLYVSPEGDNLNSGLSSGSPLKNIKFAYSKIIPDPDDILTIHLMDGTYSPSNNNEIFPITMVDRVNLAGSSMENVILDAEQTDQVLIIEENQHSDLANLSITGGYNQWGNGGGIYVTYSDIVLNNLLIYDNYSDNGGGIYMYSSNPEISNVKIFDNSASYNGGGLYSYYFSDGTLNEVQFNNNTAYYGGAIHLYRSSPDIGDVSIANNSAQYGAGIYCGYQTAPTMSSVSIHHNNGENGGGLYIEYESDPVFDTLNRCNIYLNEADNGADLYTNKNIEIIVDTFTVLYPKYHHAYPLSNFTFDIWNAMIPQVEADLYVSPQGDDTNSGLTADDPLKTIGHALIKIVEDSLNLFTIHLLEGIYSPSTNGESFPLILAEYVNLNGISSESVILDAEQTNQVLSIQDIVGVNISNVTLQGGSGNYGGGVYCINASPVFENVVLKNNVSTYSGGGMYCGNGANPLLKNIEILGNTAFYDGGGIYIDYSSSPIMENVVVKDNSSNYGGGIFSDSDNLVLNGVEVSENNAVYAGGGFYADYSSSSSFKYVTIKYNSAPTGGGIYVDENSTLNFDAEERCNIFFNEGTTGRAIYSDEFLEVVVDTFSVLYPTEYFVFPLENYSFDIQNGKIEQVDADLYVSPNGNDDNSGLIADDPLKTINTAFMKIMADSIHQHTIFLLEGTYGPSTNGDYLPINMIDYVSISGFSPNSAIIDGENNYGIIRFDDNIESSLSDLILRHGKSTYGGAIYCFNSSPVLTNLNISNNYAIEYGGGIYCSYYSSPVMTNITLAKNEANSGGGLSCTVFSHPDISNSRFKNNSSSSRGGGLHCDDDSDPVISKSEFTGNTSNRGGGAYLNDNSDPAFDQTVFLHNKANEGGGIYCKDNSDPVFINTDFSHNTAYTNGGGLYFRYNSIPIFDTINRCNIFMNEAVRGMDLYAEDFMQVVVDTFTVLYPTKFFAEPLGNFEFDILHGLIEQVDADLYVSPTGNDDNSGLTSEEALKTIHYAFSKILTDSTNPNTIHLLDGTYSSTSNGEFLPLNPLDFITISGSSMELVILDAENQSGVMEITNTEGTMVSNMTITGGNAFEGGGINCQASNPVLTNLLIQNNTATYQGGGIYFSNEAHAILENLVITNNEAENGGGICIANYSNPLLHNIKITNNLAEYEGGGINLYYNANAELDSVYLGNNQSQNYGGGMAILYDSDVSLTDVTLEQNIAGYYGGGIYCNESNPQLNNVLINGNSAVNGGGFYGNYYSNPHFSSVSIKNNWAQLSGGGVYTNYNSSIEYDEIARSNIYFNYADLGSDLYTENNSTIIVVDTFTVLIPKGHQAYPLANYTFDILNGLLPQETIELYVSPDGDNTNSGLTQEEPLQNVHYAVSSVTDDSLNFYNINLAEGTYSPSSNGESYPILLEDYTNISGESAEESILDAEGVSSLMKIEGRVNVEIANITLTGGSSSEGGGILISNSNPNLENLIIKGNSAGRGGGIYCWEANPTISHVELSNNGASYEGGGIYSENSSTMQLQDILIHSNSADHGGGVYMENSAIEFNEVVISSNSAVNMGGGLYCKYNSTPFIENVIITNNEAGNDGGGFYIYGYSSEVNLSGSSITYNSSENMGGGIYCSNDALIIFDTINRNNIYLNSSSSGFDLYSEGIMDVIVDTFTVLFPKAQHANPLSNFTFDILNGMIPQIHADLYVSPTGDDSNSGLSPEEPLKTINYALSVVAEDSINIYTVNLLEGVYSPGTNGESFPIQMVHYIELSGVSEEEVFLNAQGQTQAVIFDHIQSAKISNLTITGGYGNYYQGGGIHCYYSSPEIENITLSNNESLVGGGIYCGFFSSPTIKNVKIDGNQADEGGGIYVYYHSHPEIINTEILNNYSNFGGGIYINEHCNTVFSEVKISNNYAIEGAGMYCKDNSYPILQNTWIIDNASSLSGGGIYCTQNSTVTLDKVRIVNNTSAIEGGGIWCNSNSEFIFDTLNRSTIYFNYAAQGNELYSDNYMMVVVDTFTVMYPKSYHAFPRYNFDFDILVGLIPQVNADLYVSPQGDDLNSGLTPEEPLKTIHFATSVIAEDSLNLYTIHLSNGIYSPSTNGEYFPVYIPEYIGLEGEEMATTILNAEQTAQVMSFSYSHEVEVKNLTIEGGFNEYGYGGGIHMEYSSPILSNITIQNNYGKYGGGIMLDHSSPTFTNLTVKDNTSFYSGGGICCFDYSSPKLDSAFILGNTTSTYGGGMYCSGNSSPLLTDVTLQSNSASTGAGMYCGSSSNPVLERVMVIGNDAEHSGGGIYAPYSNMTIRNSVISQNTSTSKGGGIYLSNFSNILKNTLISNNIAKSGGGIYFSNSEPILVNLVITNNEATEFGGGIYFSVAEPIIENLTISENLAESGSGIYCYRTDIDLKNSILWNEVSDEVYFKETGSPSSIMVSNTLVQGGQNYIITNGNASIEWLNGNLLENPVFTNTGEHPYALAEGSPCIDAGWPDLDSLHLPPMDIMGNCRVWDGDGDGDTLVDIGAYEYGAVPYIVGLQDRFQIYSSDISLRIYPNPVTDQVTFAFETAKEAIIHMDITDISGNRVMVLASGQAIRGKEKFIYNLRQLNKGIYFVKINTGKEVLTKKIIKIN